MNVIYELILIVFLFVCAIGAFMSERLLIAVVIFMSYSLVMSVIWALLQSPDLAITEAAVGAGVSGILFFITLKRIHALKGTKDE
ncbi:hypothetical protein SDC9_144728 [bioreactor metagenome]|uniref:MrpA C-terminal/MbhD domain-containing protein n=1 Tax=bioreactor metagenome TaxID=1076179 RepID=A0A645E6U9_9ZZZZ